MEVQGILRGHTSSIVVMAVAHGFLWSVDNHGQLMYVQEWAWDTDGQLRGHVADRHIKLVAPHGDLLYCTSNIGTMVAVDPTIFEVVRTFDDHSKCTIASIASVQDYLWTTSCVATIVYHSNMKISYRASQDWFRVLLGVQDECWKFTDERPIEVWKMNGSKILRSISGSAHPACACVASGKVWCGDRAGGLEIFSFSGDRLFTLQAHTSVIWDFAKFGKTVLTASSDGSVRSWQISKKGKLRLIKSIPTLCLVVYCIKSLDGMLCVGGRHKDNMIVTHDAMLEWELRRVVWIGWKDPSSPLSLLPQRVILKILRIADMMQLQSVSILLEEIL